MKYIAFYIAFTVCSLAASRSRTASLDIPSPEVANTNRQHWPSSVLEQACASFTATRAAALVNEEYLIHGTRDTHPLKLAHDLNGFDTDGCTGLYSRGAYFALRSCYSHHYAHRSLDEQGERPSRQGPFVHLIVARVLRGVVAAYPEMWPPEATEAPHIARQMLGDAHDSVEGGPHYPTSHTCYDESKMCVVYKSSQVRFAATLPPMIVEGRSFSGV